MSNISISSPFTRAFTHTDVTVGTSASQILAETTNSYDKRVLLLVQNQSTTATVEVIFATTGASGIILTPGQSITIDNYNGAVRAIASAASTPVHIAYSVV